MQYANIDGKREVATPNTKAICPVCENLVFSKCGEINIWHWAHLKGARCDEWYEPETNWHKNWKTVFGKENSEKVITKGKEKHIADIFTNSEVIIELQNLTIKSDIIKSRESFYGERMLWLINGKHFKDNFRIIDIYRNDNYLNYKNEYIDKNTGEIFLKSQITDYNFEWKRARKYWEVSERNIFIDFGGSNLFWLKGNTSIYYGKVKKVSKSSFINKYEGNLSLLNLICN